MDIVNQLVAQGQFRILKVPLGFIKALQWVYFDAPTCMGPNPERLFLIGDYSSSAEFFVTIGVFAFLYSTAALAIYVFAYEKYKENNKGPLIDLGVTGVFAFMWLVSSAAWAKGLADVKRATDPNEVRTFISACNNEENRCHEVHDPVMSGLNTSVAFGFINLILWAGNLWFVFKETGIIAPFMRAPPPQEKPAAPEAYGQPGAYEQDPYAGNQGGGVRVNNKWAVCSLPIMQRSSISARMFNYCTDDRGGVGG
ncbi:hypothetical protein CRUP_007383, partial [Coryphaenoides rupestris]